MTEVDVKLNKWHIAMEQLYRKLTETEQIKKKKVMTPQWDGTSHVKLSQLS